MTFYIQKLKGQLNCTIIMFWPLFITIWREQGGRLCRECSSIHDVVFQEHTTYIQLQIPQRETKLPDSRLSRYTQYMSLDWHDVFCNLFGLYFLFFIFLNMCPLTSMELH